MDTWQDEQIRRMKVREYLLISQINLTIHQLGGNAPFREFVQSYSPVEQGGYKEGLSQYDTYHCWAATQYREKVDSRFCHLPRVC
jgi:ADP-ribosylation factor GTPase-activating protein 1